MIKDIEKTDKILITGGTGFLGQHLEQELLDQGYKHVNAIGRDICDLLIQSDVNNFIYNFNPNVIIHAAATVGGIGANKENPGKFCYENLTMGVNIVEAARKYCNNLKKFVLIGTICQYPKYTPAPFEEEYLFEGRPEDTNSYYGIAKTALMTLVQSYKKQYKFPGITLLPVNLYGIGDSFDIINNHVIPAMILKFLDAKEKNLPEVILWGTGTPTREFLYVKDCAKAIVLAMEKYNDIDPVNVGTGKEVRIDDLADMIAEKVGYVGKIKFDYTHPDGQPRRCLNIEKAKDLFGFIAETDLENGLDQTIGWFKEEYCKDIP